MKTTIDMAREAGGREVDKDDPQCCIGSMAFDEHELKAFAQLVRADERERIKEENQRCYAARGNT
jgi:hypothetical protein